MVAIANAQFTGDPRRLLAAAPMRWPQVVAVALCCLLNALDGFDVLSISFAAPGIAAQWGIHRGELGIVLSMELIGMAAGSVVLGQVADRIGRLPTTIACLAMMALGMLATTQAGGIAMLAATRLLTGIGIGGMLATTNALVAEYANDRWRRTAVAFMAAGYPLGAVTGGTAASLLLMHGDWRNVFFLGAGMALILLPLVPLLMPEPVGALLQRRPPDVLDRINHSLRALGHAGIAQLPPEPPAAPRPSPALLFTPGLRRTSILLTLAYFLHIMTFYFILKWTPKIVADMGFAPSSAGEVLVWANVGGLAGAILFSMVTLRVALRPLVVGAMLGSTVMVSLFGHAPANLAMLSLAAATAAFCTNGVIVGFYALIAVSFPTPVRAGGTGLVIGLGRAGAALGPVIAGFLFQSGLALPGVAGIMSLGSLGAALTLLALPQRREAEGG